MSHMPDKVRIFLTEVTATIWLSTGLVSYLPVITDVLDLIFKMLSCISVTILIIINYDKAWRQVKEYEWYKSLKKLLSKKK